MKNYIDGFVLPISRTHLEEYKSASEKIAAVWKEYGALAYFEYVGDDMHLEGIRSFTDAVNANEDEVIVFGWVVFESKEKRDHANAQVPQDPRMTDLIAPLTDPTRLIFDAGRMVYGGFKPLVAIQ